nr:MAG TPA: hypothetical protein [Caudoviricetes sp.]
MLFFFVLHTEYCVFTSKFQTEHLRQIYENN